MPARLDASVRLLVGPANFAGQGTRWARALEERMPGTKATSFAFFKGVLDYPVDYGVRTVLSDRDRIARRIADDPELQHRFSWAAQAEVLRSVYADVLGTLPDAAWAHGATVVRQLLPGPQELPATRWRAFREKTSLLV